MADTRTEQLARDFAAGRATAEEVVASARSAPPPAQADFQTTDYDSLMARMETDDANPTEMNSWDGVVSIYNDGGLTDDQFGQLYDLYMTPVKRKK